MYCTVDAVKGKNRHLLRDLTDEEIQTAIMERQGVVDGMMRNKYPVPLLDPIDPVISDITAMLTAAMLISDTVGSSGADKPPKQAKDLNDEAMGLLRLINAGSLVPVITQYPSLTVEKDLDVANQARCTTFPMPLQQDQIREYFTLWNPHNPATFKGAWPNSGFWPWL